VIRVRRHVEYTKSKFGKIQSARLRIPLKFLEKLGLPQSVYVELDEARGCIIVYPVRERSGST